MRKVMYQKLNEFQQGKLKDIEATGDSISQAITKINDSFDRRAKEGDFGVRSLKKQKVMDLFKDINQDNKGAGFEQKSDIRFYKYRAKLVHYESVIGRINMF